MRKPRFNETQIIAALVNVFVQHHAGLESEAPVEWGTPHRALDAALAVDLEADGVLIEQARYRREVVAPVEAFRRRHPEIQSLADLSAHIATHSTPAAFAREDMETDERRGPVLLAIIDFLLGRLDESADAPIGTTELERLAEAMGWGWTHYSDYDDVASEHVGEHGLAYLQMRLGAPVVVPEGPVFALLDEVCDGEGNEEEVAAAIHRAGLPPLAVLQALRADWVCGRAWSAAPRTSEQPEVWPAFLGVLAESLASVRPSWEEVVLLHRAAPHRPPGLSAAERRDALATVRALGRQTRPPSFAAIVDHALRALYLDASGDAMDAEIAFECAHEAAHDLAHGLRRTGEAVPFDVMASLRAVFDRAARRTTRHWYRRTW